MFTQTLSKKKFYFVVVILSLFVLMLTEENAEARRRGFFRRRVFFGKRFRPMPARRAVRCCKRPNQIAGVPHQNYRFNRFNDFDQLALARQAVDPFSSLALDPTGDISRLGGLDGVRGLQRIDGTNIAFNNRGEFFEQFNNDFVSTDRPLVFNDGKILGGAVVPLRDDTLEQVRLLNASRSLRFIRRR